MPAYFALQRTPGGGTVPVLFVERPEANWSGARNIVPGTLMPVPAELAGLSLVELHKLASNAVAPDKVPPIVGFNDGEE